MTVVLEIPNRRAIRAFGTPSAASLLISAQSSKVITLRSLSAHFSPPKLFSFRAPPTRLRRSRLAHAQRSWHQMDFPRPADPSRRTKLAHRGGRLLGLSRRRL